MNVNTPDVFRHIVPILQYKPFALIWRLRHHQHSETIIVFVLNVVITSEVAVRGITDTCPGCLRIRSGPEDVSGMQEALM